MFDARDVLFEQMRKTTRCDHLERFFVFRPYTGHQTFDEPDITPVKTRLHGRYSILADYALRPMNRNAWQKSGRLMQRLGGKIHARCDDPAFVITFCADEVEIRRGAKVHDHSSAGIEMMRSDCICEAVGAHGIGPVRFHADSELDVGI